MDLVVSNVGCSILASIIYDIGKVCFDKFYVKQDKDSLHEIEKFVQDNFDVLMELSNSLIGEIRNFHIFHVIELDLRIRTRRIFP